MINFLLGLGVGVVLTLIGVWLLNMWAWYDFWSRR